MIDKISAPLVFAMILLVVLVNYSYAEDSQPDIKADIDENIEEPNRAGTIWLPISSYRDETSVMLGSAIMHYFKLDATSKRLSSLNAVGMYTLKNQIVLILSSTFHFDLASFEFGFMHRKYPTQFYGIGNDVGDSYIEYVPYNFSASAGCFHNVTEKLALGAKYFIQSNEILEYDESTLFDLENMVGYESNITTTLALQAKWDSRDAQFFPRKGMFSQVSLEFCDNIFGSDYDFSRYTFDFRQYQTISEKQVFVYQLYGSFMTGNVPFQSLNSYNLRGFYLGKFIDRHIVYARIEYRLLPVIWRIGFVAYGSIGELAGKTSEFNTADLKLAGGMGIRIILDKDHKVNFRFDIAYGDQISVYFGAMEIF